MKTSSEYIANTTTVGIKTDLSIATLPDGIFVTSWIGGSNGQPADVSPTSIKARIFNCDGSPSTAEFTVDSTVECAQEVARITPPADGRFVIRCFKELQNSHYSTIFSANGVAQTSLFLQSGSSTQVTFLNDRLLSLSTEYSATGYDIYSAI